MITEGKNLTLQWGVKFCFLELSEFFFSSNIFDPWLVEFVDTGSLDTER